MEFLTAYQEIDKKLRSVEHVLANSEERKKASSLKQYLSGVEESASKMEQKAEELIAKYENLKISFAKNEKQLAAFSKLSNLSDLDAIKEEEKKISTLLDKLKEQESMLNSLIFEIGETTKSFTDLRKNFAKSKEDFAVYKKKYDELKTSKQAEIEQITAELKKAEKKVPKELLAIYNKKKEDKIFPPFVPVASESYCGGCSTELSLNQKNLLKSKKFVECENCRKVVYLND